MVKIAETTFLIEFHTPGLGTQSVIASRVEVRGEHLLLLNSDGQLAEAFMLDNVKSWSELSPELNH